MAKTIIGVNANITEVNRYDFAVEVDDTLTKEQQDAEAKEKVRRFLVNNIPSPNIGGDYVDGVKCVDVDYGVHSVNNIEDSIEVNED